ncbi:chitinase [Nocardioides sambongensis]|uniref:chitinase n=1 Tax=Nocardioides sambongensis TaxID=2589074 RepID=UPI00112BE6E6|nr:chitinase [Nocardioides sambongensis]
MSLVAGRRLSWGRLAVVLVAAAGLVFASLRGWQWFEDSRVSVPEDSWFAGYVDVTATPQLAFEEPSSGAGPNAVLSFVVADPDDSCEPSWGGAYDLATAGEDLDLDRRIARLRQLGGVPVASFGGQANTELAVACDDTDAIYQAYREVVLRYEIGVVDMDIEGEALADTAAHQRRGQALARLQDEEDVAVWLTVPVAPHGLAEDALDLITTTLDAGVDLAGVNVMTMNYAESKDADATMAEASIDALESTHEQLDRLYTERDDRKTSAQLWRMIGATPMLGQNDVAGEIFDLDDASELKQFAADHDLGRLSMWSLNRDRECSDNWPDVTVVSDSCSGLEQDTGAFAAVLGDDVEGVPDPDASETPTQNPTEIPSDDPATSPYQIWNEEQVYLEGERVVWHQNVYVARWWSSGDVPDDPTVAEGASAWQLLGPVLPGETPEPSPTVAAGTYPEWKPTEVYTKGDRVQLGDTAFEAQWWNQAASPDAPSTQDEPSPWRRLTRKEIAEDSEGEASTAPSGG